VRRLTTSPLDDAGGGLCAKLTFIASDTPRTYECVRPHDTNSIMAFPHSSSPAELELTRVAAPRARWCVTVRAPRNPDKQARGAARRVRNMLRCRRVAELRVEGVAVANGADFAHAAARQPLEVLALRECAGDFGLHQVVLFLPHLRELDLSGTRAQRGLCAFMARHPRLEVLRLVGVNAWAAVRAIAQSGGKFTSLRELHVSCMCTRRHADIARPPKLACPALVIHVHPHVVRTGELVVCAALRRLVRRMACECRSVVFE